jgi:PAS domain-containing protein
MKPDVEILDKEFTSDNGLLTLTRRDYYSIPIPMEASQFNDSKMQELVNTIAVHLDRDYRFTKEDIDDVDNDYAQDVLWELIESVALSMGMEYCEDVASKKQRELIELANESIAMFDEDGYIQFEKSIALNKTTYPEYDWIDGIQLVDDSIVVWLSTENSEGIFISDIFSSDIELFDEHTIDEMKSALQHTIKHLLKKS